jgi:leucyl aminopeptidase (aminopeptidase T)
MLKALRNIFTVNLKVKRNEKILIFNDTVPDNISLSDEERQRILKIKVLALLLAEIGTSYTDTIYYHEYPSTGGHGIEPPAELWEIAYGKKAIDRIKKEGILLSILKKTADDNTLREAESIINKYKTDAVNCVIALSNYSTSHTRFRDFLTRICGCRYASMPLFDVRMLETSMNVDWKELERITKNIAKVVNKAESISIKTPNGSYLYFSKKGRKALTDTGILSKPGSFGNLPAGEVFLAPVEESANGRLFIEWAPTHKLNHPITLEIKNGYVIKVTGEDDYKNCLLKILSERKENSNIAEFGIGTNKSAKMPDNILESEKIYGTIHIALGDNSSFGGKVKTPFHQDFIFFRPTVTLYYKDNTKRDIIKEGRCVI